MLFRAAGAACGHVARAGRARGVRGREAARRSRRRRVRGDRLLRVLRPAKRCASAPAREWVSRRRGRPTALRYEPRGIGVVIAPWNFPLAIPTGMVTRRARHRQRRAVQAGRADAGASRCRLVEACSEAGVPPGCSRSSPASARRSARTSSNTRRCQLRRVHRFAGGRPAHHRTGRGGAARATAREARGGRDGREERHRRRLRRRPRRGGARDRPSAFGVRGPEVFGGVADRSCVEAVFDEVVERLVGRDRRRSGRVRRGDGHRVRTVDRRRRSMSGCVRYRSIAREEGKVVIERDDVPDGGWFVGPTIVVTSRYRTRVATEEIFGPAARRCCGRDDFDHAIEIAQRQRLRADRRVCSRDRLAHRRAPVDELQGRQPLREPRDHRRARRASAVRRLRALRRGIQGGRAGLSAPVRGASASSPRTRPPGLRARAGLSRLPTVGAARPVGLPHTLC